MHIERLMSIYVFFCFNKGGVWTKLRTPRLIPSDTCYLPPVQVPLSNSILSSPGLELEISWFSTHFIDH